jgi:hypothetical protein
MSEPRDKPNQSFAIGGLIAIGALMVTLCGGCTAYFLGSLAWASIVRDPGSGAVPFILPGVLIVGGIPTLIGALVLRSALNRWRGARPPPSAPPPG